MLCARCQDKSTYRVMVTIESDTKQSTEYIDRILKTKTIFERSDPNNKNKYLYISYYCPAHLPIINHKTLAKGWQVAIDNSVFTK